MRTFVCSCGQAMKDNLAPSDIHGRLVADRELEHVPDQEFAEVVEKVSREVYECLACGRLAVGMVVGDMDENAWQWKFYRPDDGAHGKLFSID